MAALPQIPQRRDKCINFFAGVVKSQGGAKGAFQAKAAQNRLRAVMTAANGDALAVKVVANLFGPETVYYEREDASLFFCSANDVQSRDALKSTSCIHQ
jgi:hypothetical protein